MQTYCLKCFPVDALDEFVVDEAAENVSRQQSGLGEGASSRFAVLSPPRQTYRPVGW